MTPNICRHSLMHLGPTETQTSKPFLLLEVIASTNYLVSALVDKRSYIKYL